MMYCYNCSHPLDETGVCPACGKDVRLYKKALFISNKYYNDGLEKALTRNLSGAVESLRQSVKFNKANIDARNLLGLVYFEMGEVVLALGEWVISKNLQPERNLSGRYLNVMRSNPGKLENMNQAVKKFNQGLVYCENGSLDLAVIQLKKVLSINPKFVKAHQLLALLYLNAQSWGKAKSQLMKCMKVDNGSVLTQRYMHEADKMMLPEERRQVANEKKKAAGNAVEEKHGNETIIKPVHRFKATSGFNISGLIVGLVLGIAFAVFLILPARVQQITEERKEALTAISEESDAKSAKILEYETRIAALESEKDTLTADIAALLQASCGHALILFTSYAALSAVKERLIRRKLPWPVFALNRNAVYTVEQFRRTPGAVLLATGAAWEGFDFPGDSVSMLIIPRLPFPQPDAVKEKERENYATLKAYIRAVIVPEMQIKLKQGFGRAIRTETDTCAVAILDERACMSGRYHDDVLSALPEMRQADSLKDIQKFIQMVKDEKYYTEGNKNHGEKCECGLLRGAESA